MSTDPNSFDQEIKDAQGANPADPNNQGTGGAATPPSQSQDGAPVIDYQVKFAESSKEALRLLEENKKLQEQLLAKANPAVANPATATPTENLYPGFEQLDPEAQANLVAYTNLVTKRALEGVQQDPAIKFAKEQYNTSKWEQSFNRVAEKFPDLKASKDDFKSKYFKVDVVPDNIESILEDVAKAYLYDKVREKGIEEGKKQAERVDLNRATGGDKTPSVSRSLEDWARMAQDNPAKFASLSKEYNADLQSGKLKE